MRSDNYLAPRYLLKVEGTTLSADVTQFISGVEYEEAEGKASKIVLDVENPGLRFLDSKVFAEGNEVDLWMGYTGRKLTFMNRCTIVKPNPQFPRRGVPRMYVTAWDRSYKLMKAPRKDRGETFRKLRDSEIVAKVFERAGIAPETVATKRIGTRARKRGTTEWAFLRQLAKLNGYVLDVRYDVDRGAHVGWFGPQKQTGQPAYYRFDYGTGEADATLLDFYPDYSLASQVTKVEVAYYDPKAKKHRRVEVEVERKEAEPTKFRGSVGTEKLKKEVKNGPTARLTVFGQTEEVVTGRSFTSVAAAKRFASAWFYRRQEEFAFGNGAVLGVPDLRKSQVHGLRGLGNRLSGEWQFRAVAHVMGGGAYEVGFDATKVALSAAVSAPGVVSKVRAREE